MPFVPSSFLLLVVRPGAPFVASDRSRCMLMFRSSGTFGLVCFHVHALCSSVKEVAEEDWEISWLPVFLQRKKGLPNVEKEEVSSVFCILFTPNVLAAFCINSRCHLHSAQAKTFSANSAEKVSENLSSVTCLSSKRNLKRLKRKKAEKPQFNARVREVLSLSNTEEAASPTPLSEGPNTPIVRTTSYGAPSTPEASKKLRTVRRLHHTICGTARSP